MANFSRSTIQSLAAVGGFGELPDDVADTLGKDVAYMLRELTQVRPF